MSKRYSEQEEYIVELILAYNPAKKKPFKVKWLNYNINECTWESEKDLREGGYDEMVENIMAEYGNTKKPKKKIRFK